MESEAPLLPPDAWIHGDSVASRENPAPERGGGCCEGRLGDPRPTSAIDCGPEPSRAASKPGAQALCCKLAPGDSKGRKSGELNLDLKLHGAAASCCWRGRGGGGCDQGEKKKKINISLVKRKNKESILLHSKSSSGRR